MKLIKKIDQYRRDFQGEYLCQNCGHTETDQGLSSYDDDYFHDNVIPNMKCKNCNQSTNSLGLTNQRMGTKYASDVII